MEIGGALLSILIAFARIASFLYMVPLFKNRFVPSTLKLGIALSVSLLVYKQVPFDDVTNLPQLVVLLLMQIMLGAALGYVVQLIFSIPQIAGALLDMDMGFSSSSLLDPNSGQRNTLIANLYSTLFMLIFVMVGGINNLMYGLVLSFKFTDVLLFTANQNFFETLLMVFQYMLVSSVQIALPIIAAMFILNFMLMVLGKIAPQLNILFNMMPVKIAVGLLFLYFTIPVVGDFFANIVDNLNDQFLDVLESMMTK